MISHEYITNLLYHVNLVQRFFCHVNNYKSFRSGAKSWYDATDSVVKYGKKIGFNPIWFFL